MMRIVVASAVAAFIAGSAMAAQDPAPADMPTAPDATVSTEIDEAEVMDALKIVCKRVAPPTGTRIISGQTRQQMCMTRTDWEQLELDTQEAIRERDKGICAGSACAG